MRATTTEKMAPRHLVTFFLDHYYLGLSVKIVRQVLVAPKLYPIPLAESKVSGLLCVRGQILPAIDLRSCLGLGERTRDAEPMHLVLEGTNQSVSLLVDTVGEVLPVDAAQLHEAPMTLDPVVRQFVDEVLVLSHVILLILDERKLLEQVEAVEQ